MGLVLMHLAIVLFLMPSLETPSCFWMSQVICDDSDSWYVLTIDGFTN